VFISDEPFLNLAKPIKAVTHVGCSAGLGFISGIGCELLFGMGGFFSIPSKQSIQAKSGSNSISSIAGSYQTNQEAIPHLVLPLVPTPATASAWCGQLHRRVQLHRHHFCGNLPERSAKSAQ